MKTKQTLLTPTPAHIKHRNRLWARALVENKKKAVGCMRKSGGRCCLAVAEDVAKARGVDVWPDNYLNTPSIKVVKFFGWNKISPVLQLPDGSIDHAANINDVVGGNGLAHKQIAECVLNTFVHPKNPKWSFKL